MSWVVSARWVVAAAIIALIGVALGLLLRQATPRKANRLLAEAYTQQRTLEMRIPGAAYGPLRRERAPERSRMNRPPALLDAEALIARHISASPNDPDWLQARARAELLDWQYASAIRGLERSAASNPDSPEILVDLATAYFERAEAEDQASDYGPTIEFLSRALAIRPSDPVALFNRAIAYERMFHYQLAVEDWQHYLEIDPKSGWATEARSHLKELIEKIKTHGEIVPLSRNPAVAVVALRNGARNPMNRDWPDSRDEEYLDLAVTEWLPSLYAKVSRNTVSVASPDLLAALTELAHLLYQQHSDRWLVDILASRPTVEFVQGLTVLGSASRATSAGDPDQARRYATDAEKLFEKSGSRAGVIRARLERVFAAQRAQQADVCLASIRSWFSQTNLVEYTWIRIQTQLEESSCASMAGDLNEAQKSAAQALALIRRAGYGSLLLRCLGFVASLDTDKGDVRGAWTQDRAGLALFWEGHYPPLRAYQFYSDLSYAAEESGRWRLALAVARETVAKVAPTPNRSLEALARFRLAIAASMCRETALADAEFARAEQLFGTLPQTPALKAYRASAEIHLASIDAEYGDHERPYAQLVKLRSEMSQISNYLTALRFYGTLGQLQLLRGEAKEAQGSLYTAINISERGAASLTSDPDRLSWDRETGSTYRTLVRLRVVKQGDRIGALEAWERYRGRSSVRTDSNPTRSPRGKVPSIADLMSNANAPPMKGLSDSLRYLSRESVISYAALPEGLMIWEFDDRGIHTAWQPGVTAGLKTIAMRFAEECADRTSDLAPLQRDASTLYQLLISPVAKYLEPGRTTVIEPDTDVASFPFEALMNENGQYVGMRYSISYSPSVGYLFNAQKDSKISRKVHALVVGAPTVAAEIAGPPLTEAAGEAQAVASHFDHVVMLSGRQATLEMIETRLPSSEVFHFAGHSISNARHAGLILVSPPGQDVESGVMLLSVEGLNATMLRRCQLAVLSACSTAGDESGGIVDPNSLARAFLLAGVPRVVASRWDVDSTATAEFMRRFYDALLSGSRVADAIQTAANDVRNTLGTEHPFYWAAFSLFGRN